ncbi:MAG: hypothetical protein ABSH50_15415, partial [Bryobacteraceae bacterium]
MRASFLHQRALLAAIPHARSALAGSHSFLGNRRAAENGCARNGPSRLREESLKIAQVFVDSSLVVYGGTLLEVLRHRAVRPRITRRTRLAHSGESSLFFVIRVA